jgi:hypothetical protein
MFKNRRIAALAVGVVLACSAIVRADNQTATLSPVVVGDSLPFSMQIQDPLAFATSTPPSLHSFARGSYFEPAVGHSQWLMIGGMTNGLHSLGGSGFDPASHNETVCVIDPLTQQVWGRSLNDASSGLSTAQVASLRTTNAQYTQKGNRLYIAGGYGWFIEPQFGDTVYQTFDNLTAIDLPGLMSWVKTGAGSASSSIRQISDPIVQVTGGEMLTTSNGKTHLVFGQNYEAAYEPRLNGVYTQQVRTFNIVDDGVNLSLGSATYGAVNSDYRRRDLNVVPSIRKENGQTVEKMTALSGVFTTSFGAWTVPVNIDDNGNASEPDATNTATFKQGMNGYRCASINLYSAVSNTSHTLLLGGISYQYVDPTDGQIKGDAQLPFISSCTDIVTDGNGNVTQHLLPGGFPAIVSPNTGQPLLLGAETEFFLRDGIPAYANGVIDLDALTGPTLIGWLFGGIAAEQPNGGPTFGSNAVFPVVISPNLIPEPNAAVAALFVMVMHCFLTRLRVNPKPCFLPVSSSSPNRSSAR